MGKGHLWHFDGSGTIEYCHESWLRKYFSNKLFSKKPWENLLFVMFLALNSVNSSFYSVSSADEGGKYLAGDSRRLSNYGNKMSSPDSIMIKKSCHL